MSTDTQLDMEALLESVLAGHPLDAETAAHIREQAEKITEEVRQRCGTVDVVQLIREVHQNHEDGSRFFGLVSVGSPSFSRNLRSSVS